MSLSEQPPRPRAHSSETSDEVAFERHTEFVEEQETTACNHLAERLTAYVFGGTACFAAAMCVYDALQGGESSTIAYLSSIGGIAGSGSFMIMNLLDKIDKLQSKHTRDK